MLASHKQENTSLEGIISTPKLRFVFRERFWFNEKASQEFYHSILDDIVINAANGSFFKSTQPSVFLLSPKYLLDRVREECQEVLMRGYIYEGRSIDENLIKELHHNATEYLTKIQLATGTLNYGVEQSTKPMIYYKVSINDRGLEVLAPYLYIPTDMINEVRARRGGLVKTNLLEIIPENLTPEELLVQTKQLNQILYETLLEFFNQNPEKTKYLHNKAIELKNQGNTRTSSLDVYGDVKAKKLLSILEGKILVQGSINGDEVILASLMEDVNIKSKTDRTNYENTEAFDKAILLQAKIHTDNSLRIFAKNKVAFEGSYNNSSKFKSSIDKKFLQN